MANKFQREINIALGRRAKLQKRIAGSEDVTEKGSLRRGVDALNAEIAKMGGQVTRGPIKAKLRAPGPVTSIGMQGQVGGETITVPPPRGTPADLPFQLETSHRTDPRVTGKSPTPDIDIIIPGDQPEGGIDDDVLFRGPEPDPTAIQSMADDSPEMAAFKALLDAPSPVFEKAGFTMAERAALGFLAGLKGHESVQPVIEGRRREATIAYQAARGARADRLQGLYQSASLAERIRSRKQAGRIAEEKLDILAAAAAAKAGKLLPIGEGTATDIGLGIKAAKAAQDFVTKFLAQGQPGGAMFSVLPPMTQAQIDTKRDLQISTNSIKKDLLGAARTLTELADVSNFLPSFGARDAVVLSGMQGVVRDTLMSVRAKIRSLKATGRDVSGLEQMLRESGLTGSEMGVDMTTPPPAGLTLDPFYVLADEGGF